MRARTLLFAIVLLFVCSATFADEAAEEMQTARTQRPYNVPASTPPPPAVLAAPGAAVVAETPTAPREVVVIHLDNTGVSDWTFINPRRPAKIPAGAGLEFRNATGDRTFVVSIPVSFKTMDPNVRFAILNRELGAAEQRLQDIGASLLPGAVQLPDTLSVNSIAANWDTLYADGVLESLDSHTRVRELIRDMDVSNPTAIAAIESIDLAPYRVAIESAGFLTDFKAVETAADAVPKPLAPLATRLRVLAATLRSFGTLPRAASESEVVIAKQQAIDRLRALAGEILANPGEKKLQDLKTERATLEAFIEDRSALRRPGTDAVQERFLRNELARLRRDFPTLELYINSLKARISDQLAFTPERATAVRQQILDDLDAATKPLFKEREKVFDKPIADLQDSETRRRRFLLTWLTTARRRAANDIDARIALRSQVLADLSRQGVTDAEEVLEGRFGVEISGCATDDGTLSCTASQTIPPNQTAIFGERFLRLSTPAETVFIFTVRFFDEADVPSYPTVYLTRAAIKPKPPANSFSWNLVGTVGQVRDPQILNTMPTPPATLPEACLPLRLCAEGHRNHFTGSGQLQLKQRVADYFEGSATVAFKSGDLGTPNPDPPAGSKPPKDEVTFSRYKFAIFAENGLALEFGKQTYAAPSQGISISETGEGFRVIYSPMFVSGAVLVKRESQEFSANRENRDSWVFLGQANNVPLMSAGPVRSISLTYARGYERRFPVDTAKLPYNYESAGADIAYAIPVVNVNGNFGGYYNRRDADNDTTACTLTLACNARGNALLATMTRAFGLDSKNKSRRSVTLTFARGSGDDDTTPNVNEGYAGETGSFAPDVVFLKTLVGPMNSTQLAGENLPALPAFRFGSGISNKTYFGATYVENSFSPLYILAHDLFGIEDITSYSTTVKYHNYRLREPVDGERGAGHEFNLEFMIEGPKGVKTTIGAGWYLPGMAVAGFVDRNLWSAYSNVSVSFGQ